MGCLLVTLLTQNGDRKLSEVARHLVMPEGIVSTAWPSIEAQLDVMGIPLDRWQQGFCQVILGKRKDGKYACGIGGAVASIPRQSGKTYTLGALMFALCLASPGTLALWTAHRSRTHNETFKSMDGMAQRKDVAPFVSNIRKANGEQEIEFTNGSRILFGARENGFGRGFAKVDVLVFDEAQILTEKAMEDMVPATNSAPNALVMMIGTPPRPTDPGEVFTNRRDEALSGDDADVLYVEMSADRNANPDDRKQWSKANPSFPGRTDEGSMLRMRKLLGSVESFEREGLGKWDERSIGQKAVRYSTWESMARSAGDLNISGRRIIGVRFSVDGASIALAGAISPDGPDEPYVVEAMTERSTGEGTQWLIDYLTDHHKDLAQIVIDGKAGVGYLVNALRQNGVVNKRLILTPSTDEVIAAHGMLSNAVKETENDPEHPELVHSGQQELDVQVKSALQRKIGSAGGFGWQAPPGGSVTLFEAVTLAHWGARVSRRRPGRRQRFR